MGFVGQLAVSQKVPQLFNQKENLQLQHKTFNLLHFPPKPKALNLPRLEKPLKSPTKRFPRSQTREV
jgi:hypothetical protein